MVYKCEDCYKIYKTKKSLRVHIKIKHSRSAQPSQCVKCDKHFLNNYSLKEHLRYVHPSKLHYCSFCGSRFKTKHYRDTHITWVHTKEKHFSCKICPSKFSTANGLKIHQVAHTDDRHHGCKLCPKRYKYRSHLRYHVKVVHTNRIREFPCIECNKAFFTKSDLNRHQNIHNREGFSKCYFCQKKFSQHNLVTHTRIHTQEKPFTCTEKFCNYSSARLHDVKMHQRRFHSSKLTSSQINGRIWECYFCFKSYRQFGELILHMRHHTKEVPFKCGFCKKKYIRQESLTLHIASHTNEKAFSCSKCDKEFIRNGDLNCHMVTHTKEKRYFCEFCSYASYFRRSLRKHISKRHTM